MRPASRIGPVPNLSFMNSTFAFTSAARPGYKWQPGLPSDHMLAASLALHSETMALFRANLFGGKTNSAPFADQVRQHEASSGHLGAQSDAHGTPISPAHETIPPPSSGLSTEATASRHAA